MGELANGELLDVHKKNAAVSLSLTPMFNRTCYVLNTEPSALNTYCNIDTYHVIYTGVG